MSRKQWHQLKTPLALVKLLQFRNRLRENNLHDTSQITPTDHLPNLRPVLMVVICVPAPMMAALTT